MTHPATPKPNNHESEGKMILLTRKSNTAHTPKLINPNENYLTCSHPLSNNSDNANTRNACLLSAEMPLSG